MTRMTKNWILLPSLQIAPPCAGRRDTTDAKIRIDMPLPMPRWVMSSASHITIAVPAVHVSTISAARPGVEVRDQVLALEAGEPEQPRCCPGAGRTRSRCDCTMARPMVT